MNGRKLVKMSSSALRSKCKGPIQGTKEVMGFTGVPPYPSCMPYILFDEGKIVRASPQATKQQTLRGTPSDGFGEQDLERYSFRWLCYSSFIVLPTL